MIQVSRISHATFETPDLQKTLDYHANVSGLKLLERDGRRAFLAAKNGLPAIQLQQGSAAGCRALAFQLSEGADLVGVRQHLSEHGIAFQERTEFMPGTASMLSFQDPNGTTIELYSGVTFVDSGRDGLGVGPLKLGHVAFFSKDPRALFEFYQSVLGFRLADWIEDFFVFMRCNSDHHTVNFIKGDAPRIHHIAFELRDRAHVVGSCDLLAEKRIPVLWGPLRFGPGHNFAVFHRDQDNHLVEFYAELDQMKDETLGYYEPRPWHRDHPQRPKVWSRHEDMIWGTPLPPGFM